MHERFRTLVMFGILAAGALLSTNVPLLAQCYNCCPNCSDMCGETCLDGMKCQNGQPMQCSGGQPYCPTTPIIIDLLGEGFQLTDMNRGVKFSFGGYSLQTSWTDQRYSNAWLVLDRNGNGVIDDASEFFGDFTPQPPSAHPNGYRALAVFDDPRNGGNGNGRIDPGDAIYSSLRLWIDRNHDGVSQPEELVSLTEAGVVAISLHYWEDDKLDDFGNQFRFRAKIWDEYGHEDPRCYDVFIMVAPPPSLLTQGAAGSSSLHTDSKGGDAPDR